MGKLHWRFFFVIAAPMFRPSLTCYDLPDSPLPISRGDLSASDLAQGLSEDFHTAFISSRSASMRLRAFFGFCNNAFL